MFVITITSPSDKRTKGWRMPAGAVYVGRPTKGGNPWSIGEPGIPNAAEAVLRFRATALGFWSEGNFCRTHAHLDSVIGRIIADALAELGGRDLACWYPLDQPCHADALLELANGLPRGEERGTRDREGHE